jgi:hypothetical protein
MPRRIRSSAWAKAFEHSFLAIARNALRANARAARLGLETQAKGLKTQTLGLKIPAQRRQPPPGEGDWIAGLALGAAGARRYRLYRPPGTPSGERLPLLVMLHGCGQDARSFAVATRMNRDRGARALSGALPRTGPPGQRPGLLELVRHPLRARLR